MQAKTWNLEEVYEELKKEDVNLNSIYEYTHPVKTKGKSKNLSLGKIWFQTLMPDDFRLVIESVDKGTADDILKEIFEKYGSEAASETLTVIQKEAFKLSSINPRSFRADAFTPSEEWKDAKKEFVEKAKELSDEDFEKEVNKLSSMLMEELRIKGIGITDGEDGDISGKVGSNTWKQLMISKGATADIEGKVSRIIEGTSDGYSIENYYTSAAEARRGFYYKSTAVRDPGYLARKVTMGNANLKLTGKDCKTTKYLELYADSQKAKTLVGRYYLKDEKLELIKSSKDILNQRIKLRSPIWCKQKDGICSVCYGQLSEKLDTQNIGILAGGAVNNEAVNAMMKLRHSAKQVDVVDVDFEDYLKKSTIDHFTLSKYLNIGKNEITAKKEVSIYIDRNEYTNKELTELTDRYQLPGIIDVFIGDGEDKEGITLPFNFTINLYKPQNMINHGKTIILNFVEGELIFQKDKYIKDINPAVISRLFDGVTKYIKDPAVLLETLSKELKSIDSVHIEAVISNMFRDKNDTSQPSRLNKYKNPVIIGCKQLPFQSWLGALAFEDIDKAVKTGLVSNKDAELNPIEQRLIEKQQW